VAELTVVDIRAVIAELAEAIEPFDERERRDRAQFVAWCHSGAALFRTLPPATPPQHLAVYFVLLDAERRSVMLVEHRKAGLRLPPGGHVDDGEDPRTTVVREAAEELGLAAQFHPLVNDRAFFVTATETQGPDSHTDMTLWFLLEAYSDEAVHGDPREFAGWGWVGLDDNIDWHRGFDPQLYRFVAKLRAALDV
jgi:8-oxo-dGTP pyrophosphatase MutT (NUDIX family)